MKQVFVKVARKYETEVKSLSEELVAKGEYRENIAHICSNLYYTFANYKTRLKEEKIVARRELKSLIDQARLFGWYAKLIRTNESFRKGEQKARGAFPDIDEHTCTNAARQEREELFGDATAQPAHYIYLVREHTKNEEKSKKE